MVKKLVAKEFLVDEETAQKTIGEQYKVGDKFSYMQDPETGKNYMPKEGFTIEADEGQDLNDLFVEVN